MASITVQFIGTAGQNYKAIPSSGSLANYVASGVSASPVAGQNGKFTIILDDAVATKWTVFRGLTQPTSWELFHLEIDLSDESVLSDVLDRLDAIDASTSLIGNANAAVIAMVSPTGEIASPLIIGDDYLAANERAFTWDLPAITGVTVGTATAYFGGKMINGEDNWLASGTVTDIGSGQWRISVDLPKTATADLQPGRYRWSCEIRSASGTEITRVRNAGDNKTVMLVNKQT